MALSGSKQVNFCSRNGANRFYLKWTWSATQNIANNQSTVTVKLYIGSHGNGYSINSSASKSGSITIDGTAYSFSNTCSISSGGSKLLATKSKTITHNGDGTKSFSINASFNPNISISGTTQGNVTMGATSYTLNTIARASTISCNGKWTFPGNHTISISRKSSSFKHTVRVYVGGTLIKTWTKTASTSFSTSFTTAENTTIAGKLGTASATPSVATKIEVDTYSGSTKIGSTASVSGTCTATTRSTTTFTNNWNIGATISGKITENNGAYTHTLQILNSSSSAVATILNKSTTLSWSYATSGIASTLYALTPNSNSYTGKIRLYTYYNGVQIGTYAQSNMTFKVTGSNPTFSPTLSYSDTNSTISAITTSNQYIVQGKSTLRVVVGGMSSTTLKALNSATMKTLQVTVAGVTKSQNYNASTTTYNFDFGTINATSNQSASISAIDSRGNKTTKSLVINCLPYSAPKLTAKVERANKFSTTVNVNASGTYSALTVNGSAKNGLNVARYIWTKDNATTGTTVNLTANASNGSFKATQSTFTLTETSIASVQVVITDKLGGTATTTISVPTGLPIMFVDAEKGNISFNALPDMTKEANMKIGMNVDCAVNQWWDFSNKTGDVKKYGLNLNNSDMIMANAFMFGDATNGSNNEGIFFPNTGADYDTPESKTGVRQPEFKDCTRLYAIDGQLWLADTGKATSDGTNTSSGYPISCIGRAGQWRENALWEGAYYLNNNQTITLSGTKSLYNQPNGWCLVWSDYNADPGASANSDFVFTFIPKFFRENTNIQGKSILNIIPRYHGNVSSGSTLPTTWITMKTIYVTNTTIKGHDANDDTGNQGTDVCLRYVYSW